MEITETVKDYVISFQYDPYKIKAVKDINGSWFEGKNKVWHVPRHRQREINYLRQRFHVTELKNAEDILPEQVGDIPELPDLDIELSMLKKTPFPYQNKGIAGGRQFKRCIIGDQMGLGKTFEAIAIVCSYGINLDKYLTAGPGLVICPSTLKLNWQTEWMEVAGHRTMILSDRIKNTWQQYYKVGMCDTFICNYESLRKYFVEPGWNKPKEGQFKLNQIPFRECINIFKWIIIDESHKCFPYETKILTNKGLLEIGNIVENKLTDLLVASVNLSDFSVSLKKIKNVWKNELRQRKIYCIRHNKGKLYATEDHKIYTTSGRYKKVCEIQSGEDLYLLREEFLNNEGWKNNSEILLKKLCFQNNKRKPGGKGEDGQKQKVASNTKSLRLVRHIFFNKGERKSFSKGAILQPELQCQMASDSTGSFSSSEDGSLQAKEAHFCIKTKVQQDSLRDSQQKDDRKQPNVIGRNQKKSFGKTKRQTVPNNQRRQRSINKTPGLTKRGHATNFRKHGISYRNSFCKGSIPSYSELLQSRYCSSKLKNSNRNRRDFSQSIQSERARCSKNKNIELVRVESVEIHQQGNINGSYKSSRSDKFVYDLEIAENHNYFADGILVSNCKDSSTIQSKIVMGICKGKQIILELTGTPLLNKTKDLIAQLHIIDRLKDVVDHLPQPLTKDGKPGDTSGYKRFIERYCGGGNESTNLKELNYRLYKHCFFRREKSEVLKDLPEKMRQVVRCEISNTHEYHRAETEFADYLREVKGCSDLEVKKKLRGEMMVKIGILKQIAARGKLEAAKEFIEEVTEGGQKIVVFIHLKEIAAALKEMFQNAVTITGDDSMDDRDRHIKAFQNSSNTNIIICSLQAGGVGITLTASSEVLFIEYPWTFALCEQAEDRTHRIGQKNNVRATYLLGDKTIDEYCYYDIIQKKKNISQEVTGSTDDVVEEMIDNLLNLFNQK